MAYQNYKNLQVWQYSMGFVVKAYVLLEKFPPKEQYALTEQLRRSLVSIPSNIAEGHGRTTTNDFLRFLNISHGSLNEAETQFILAMRLNYISPSEFDEVSNMINSISKMLYKLKNSFQPIPQKQ